jgi:hypothetical protein
MSPACDLDELTAGTEARNLKRRLGPRRNRDAGSVREVTQQPPHPGVDCIALELVVIVERKHERAPQRIELADQYRKHLADQVDTWRPEKSHRPRCDVWINRPECLEDVAPEAGRIAVGAVERHPGKRAPSLLCAPPL